MSDTAAPRGALAFLAAEHVTGVRAAFLGRALFSVNSVWDCGRGSSSVANFVRTLIIGYAGGALCSVLMLASSPPVVATDVPLVCMTAAWTLFFGTRSLFGQFYRSLPGTVIGIIMECMFRANLVRTYTVRGAEKLGTNFGPIACGLVAGTGAMWLKDGVGAAGNLAKPGTPMFLALLTSIGTLLCTNAERYSFPLKLAPKKAQRCVVLVMIASELAKLAAARKLSDKQVPKS